uniref:Clusterin n=1 Tax=Mola mola TaxID=94237 RepID=A0A3Q3WT98_MOLML
MKPRKSNKLSEKCEKLVDEEVRRALYGVKQMKEVMWKNEQKHEHLMKSLKHSSDKKKEAAQLAKEVTEKLEEAEERCRDSLQSEWEECRPCLEDVCKTFYTSTCRRGFPLTDPGDILVNQGPDDADKEVARIEDSFNHLIGKVGTLVARSVALVSRMSTKIDIALQKSFLNDTDTLTEETTSDPYSPSHVSGFLQGVGLEEVLDSFFDFGKSVLDEFGAVVTQVFDDISEAVQEEKMRGNATTNRVTPVNSHKHIKCPNVRELHVELDEVSQLLDVSKDQYDEILSIVQRHTDETVDWLSNMAAEFGWLTSRRENVEYEDLKDDLSALQVAPKNHDEQNVSVSDTKVEVNILNSPPLILSVPGELELQDPAFIQYVTQEALNSYKEMAR